ncbi:DUF6111 family protein [Skermanella mucosa]|uniref:DUF6111 family protein n=1 Tax=Skermanella mucosa TaxID=1789672 RepID=UPI00192C6EC7|nr:DUF6111 family protein [Skermanella mucosa]UEM22007.1 DUF6111 family protein [Skermanella mucosa]
MLKKLLLVVLPLMLPTLIYMGYMLIERRKAVASGGTALPWWAGAPWTALVVGGVALAGLSLTTLALTGGSDTTATYHPARLIDGRVVEGDTTPSAPAPGR